MVAIFGRVVKRVKKTKMKRVLILDGTNNFYRAFVVDPSMSSNGKPIGGVKGFLKILQKLFARLSQIKLLFAGTVQAVHSEDDK